MTGDRSRPRGGRVGGDRGTTLIEVMMGLAVMAVLMTVVTAGILQVFRVVVPVENASSAQSQLHAAFQRVDKEIRYASWVATPGQVGVSWYVEFALAGNKCEQLRLNTTTRVLQLLRWTVGAPPFAGQAGQTVASQVFVDGSSPPFERQAAGSYPYATATAPADAGADFAPDYDRLRVRLSAQVGGSTERIDTTFTALNTGRTTTTTNACSLGRP